MGKIEIECHVGSVSDGHHTFTELYEHRNYLFVALMQAYPSISWRSYKDAEGKDLGGWFIAGMRLPTGGITYHLSGEFWPQLDRAGIKTIPKAEWDGHTSDRVLQRIIAWVGTEGGGGNG